MKKTIAIYPGSFNKAHTGHLNILEKAERIFGKGNVILSRGVNPDKLEKETEEQKIERINKIKKYLSELQERIGRQVDFYDCFLHEYIKSYEDKGYNVVVIRGLRNGDDLNYEINQLKYIKTFNKRSGYTSDLNVIFINCDDEFEHISSSGLRKVEEFGGSHLIQEYI